MGAAAATREDRSQDSLSGLFGAYSYSIFLVAGPWIVMVVAIAGISQTACPSNQCATVDLFRSVVIYNFLFSLLLAGPICLPLVRLVSDDMFAGKRGSTLGANAVALLIFTCIGGLFIGPFYAFAPSMPGPEKLASFQNFMLMGATWLIAPFLGTLLDYKGVSLTFLAGAIVMLGTAWVSTSGGAVALLDAFSLGLVVINAGMLWRLAQTHGSKIRIEWRMLAAFRRYWQLAAFSLVYYLGIWVDNLIMWFAAPTGVSRVAGVLQTMPDYDTVMFIAQLTTIPVLAFFALHVEGRLYELNRQFQLALAKHASRREIDIRIGNIGRFVIQSIASLFGAAIVIMIMVMLASFWGMDRIGVSAKQMGMLRAGLLGVAFHTTAMFCCIFLMFFDMRRAALTITLVFFISNAILTLAFLPLGFAYFGYGNLLAGAIALAVGFWLLVSELPWLCYHAFVTNNVSLGRAT